MKSSGIWMALRRVSGLCMTLCVLAWLMGCSGGGSGEDHAAIEANQASFQGQQVYQRVCAGCHDATDLHLIKDPPHLDSLFRKPTFPSGAPATDDGLRNVILHGRGIMPPFEQALTADDVNALIQYMHTR
jgi:cytochrome c5